MGYDLELNTWVNDICYNSKNISISLNCVYQEEFNIKNSNLKLSN